MPGTKQLSSQTLILAKQFNPVDGLTRNPRRAAHRDGAERRFDTFAPVPVRSAHEPPDSVLRQQARAHQPASRRAGCTDGRRPRPFESYGNPDPHEAAVCSAGTVTAWAGRHETDSAR